MVIQQITVYEPGFTHLLKVFFKGGRSVDLINAYGTVRLARNGKGHTCLPPLSIGCRFCACDNGRAHQTQADKNNGHPKPEEYLEEEAAHLISIRSPFDQ